MPDRIVRDELLRSHRYRTLTSDTLRLLFVHLVLCADSLGNCEATTTALGDAMGRQVDEATAAKWLTELGDVDIVRVYEVDGKRYCHIPKFRQRLRYPNGKHPRPPAHIECHEIRELAQKVRPESDYSRQKRGEEKRSDVPQRAGKPVDKSEPVDKWWLTDQGRTLKGKALGVIAHPGEDRESFYQRICAAIQAKRTQTTT
jgi:hypothetical protein